MIRITRHTHLALLLLSLLALFSSVAIASRGRTANLTDADGSTTTWTFDALNHNTAVIVPGQGTTAFTYFPSGLPTTTRPDGSSTTTSYDLAGRIANIVHSKGDSELAHESYDYDANGNRTTQRESNGAVTGNVEQVTTYTYDTADRLTDIQASDRTTHYVLDAVGNRSSEQITDTQNHPIGNSTLSYDARDELTQRDDSVSGLHITLAYDLDGNTLSQTDASGTRTFGYDANDRLLTLSQPGQLPLTFDYQSDGQRIAKHQGNTETRYQYDQNSLLAETNAIGNTLTRYHYSATQLISRSEAGSTPTYRHYLLDALKTPVALLTQDGAISARTSYDVWGEIIAQQGTGGAVTIPARDGTNAELPSTDQQDVGYTGYLKDTENGLYYAKARYYDPRTARFTTQDPEDGKAMQPPSLHRYLYAYANPTVYTDPSGRCADVVCSALYSWSYARNDDERSATIRNLLNSDPTLGRTAGVAMGAAQLAMAPVNLGNDIGGALDGDAGAKGRMGSRLSALGEKVQEAAMNVLQSGPMDASLQSGVQMGREFVQGVVQHVQQMRDASASQDYVSQGEAGFNLGLDASVVIPAVGEVSAEAMAVRGIRTLERVGAADASVVMEGASGQSVTAPIGGAKKYANRLDVKYRAADEVNADFAEGFKPPYQSGTRVTEYTTRTDDQFVRVHGETNKARSWMMRREAIEGLDAQEISKKYSLPSVPDYISDVNVPAGTSIRTGKVFENFGGNEGAVQYELLQRLPEDSFTNTRPISYEQ